MASVTSLTLTDSGQRYSTIPNVIISVPDADSTGATATTTIDSAVGRIPGRVSTISLTEGGNYYIDSPLPTITFSSPTTDSAEGSIIISSVNDSGLITGVTIQDSGMYYISPPALLFPIPTLDSAPATATANISNGLVTSANLLYGGRYYFTVPTVTVEPPIDSNLYNKTTFVNEKFGYSSLQHTDSSDRSVLSDFGSGYTFDSSYGSNTNKINELSFWMYFDSVKAGTIIHNKDFRIHTDENGFVGITFNNESNITKYNNTNIPKGSWQFVQVQTLHEQQNNTSTKLRLSVGGSYDSTYDVSVLDSSYNSSYYDNGDTLIIGADNNSLSPIPFKKDGTEYDSGSTEYNRSFNGYIDNLTFTHVNNISSFDSDQSIRIPDSANNFYYNTIPVIHQTFDYDQAFILASIDDSEGIVVSLLVTESGLGYTNVPSITIDNTGPSEVFKAQGYCELDSERGGGRISEVYFSFNGRFYDSSIIGTAVTIINETSLGTAADFRAQATPIITNGSVSGFTITDSGNYYLENPTVTIEGPTGTAADFRATGRVFLDSDNQKISSILLTDGGRFYETVPSVRIEGGDSAIDFEIGEIATQTLASGVIMSGEVAKWSDSDRKLHLIHVGANDGDYHNFVINRQISAPSRAGGLVRSVSEDNKISKNEQNEQFSPSVSNELDFLDFTENNPFGDPENN